MHICQILIKNYRCFPCTPFILTLKPFTLILGENNVGKTNLLNAVALLFGQEVSTAQRRTLELDDFNYASVTYFRKQVADTTLEAAKVEFPDVVVQAQLTDFDHDQEAVVGDWFTDGTLATAQVTYRFALRANFNREKWLTEQRELLTKLPLDTSRDKWKQVEFPLTEYRYTISGGTSASNECESHHLRMLRVEILDALRDARDELMGGGDNRVLYRVLKQGADSKYVDLKEQLAGLEKCIQSNTNLVALKSAVQATLHRLSLQSSPDDNSIDFQFSSPDAAELLKKIGMIYGVDPVNVGRNGLGRNNLLYLSLVLSQLARTNVPTDDSYACFRFVGVEEPEAHLHPHLQDHLARNIESLREEHTKHMQLLLTTHSTHIASKLSLSNTVVLFRNGTSISSHYILDGFDEKKEEHSIRFLHLYLDATKSRMFFARSIILVEGISEQLIIPRLFEAYGTSGLTLEAIGCTVVNVEGVAFSHFLRVVKNGYFKRCVALTDSDNGTKNKDRAEDLKKLYDTPDRISVQITTQSTFEKDLIAANLAGSGKDIMLKALRNTRPIKGKAMAETTTNSDLNVEDFFAEIEGHKSEFAFNLAAYLTGPDCGIQIPAYIAAAFEFLGEKSA